MFHTFAANLSQAWDIKILSATLQLNLMIKCWKPTKLSKDFEPIIDLTSQFLLFLKNWQSERRN